MYSSTACLFLVQLISNADTTSLGLNFLMTVSEELASPQTDYITSQRQEELSALMKDQAPAFLGMVMSLLDSVVERQRHTVAPTPPPSPNVSPVKHAYSAASPVAPPSKHHLSLSLSESPPTFGGRPSRATSPSQHHLLHPSHGSAPFPTALSPQGPAPSSSATAASTSTAESSVKHTQFHIPSNIPFIPLDSKTESLCSQSLKSLAHLFGWIPLSNVITPLILDTIFYFASLGCESVEDSTEGSGDLGSVAMDCVNELLVRNCVPREFEAFLLKLFEKSFGLLQRLTGETERGHVCNFSLLDERWVEWRLVEKGCGY